MPRLAERVSGGGGCSSAEDARSSSSSSGGSSGVILRVLAMAQPGGVLLYDRVLRWRGVCSRSGSTGNATSICSLVASLAKLAQEMKDAPEMEEIRRSAWRPPSGIAALAASVAGAAAALAATSTTSPTATEEQCETEQQQQQQQNRVLSVLFDSGAKITTALGKMRRSKNPSAEEQQHGGSSSGTEAATLAATETASASTSTGDADSDGERDESVCVRMAVAPGKRTALCVFHIARPQQLLSGNGPFSSTTEYTRAVDAMLCDAADAFEEAHAADLDRLAARIDECSRSDGAVVLTSDEKRCFDGFVERVVTRACAERSLGLCTGDDEGDDEEGGQR